MCDTESNLRRSMDVPRTAAAAAAAVVVNADVVSAGRSTHDICTIINSVVS